MENEARETVNDKREVTTSEQRAQECARRFVGRVIEYVVIAVMIAVVWGLFSLPTVFFFMEKETMISPTETQTISNQSNGTTMSSKSQPLPKPAAFNITCSRDFYLDTDAGYCKPVCGQWKVFPDDVVGTNAVIVIISSVVGIAGEVLILAISSLKKRQMFKFPSILLLYQYTSVSLFLFVNVIGYFDTQTFLCPSQDASESFTRTTPYCILFGISVYYFLNQAEIFWAEHIAAVLMLIAFPFKAKYFELSGHLKIIHILMLVVALVLPIGFMAVPLATGGFRPFYYPNTCGASNSNASYYALVLPLSILAALGISLLILLFWILIKRNWIDIFTALSKNIRKLGAQRKDPRNSTIQTTALIKVSFSFVCYAAVTSLGIASLTLYHPVQSQHIKELTEYFICESSGVRPDKVCEKTYETLYNPFPSTITLLFLGILWPSVTLLYVLNLKKAYFYFKQKMCLSTANNTETETESLEM